ncbi:hypothetical protein GTV32_21255 [Gordonia sp. SID5947]|uniref:hypothetical protein n=1 Tax=Gordonia sp. SID5947 TaxID=2690315 RepID=UPI00136F1C1F|nr:hypothetical protein [Gordonia sp. SID5947]MYR08679.1 hypothetical protein [Gordonia sp. SID5947]
MTGRRTTIRTATCVTAAVGMAMGAIAGSGAASAAPPKALRVDQVPNVGVTVDKNGLSGGFAANLAATATSADATRLRILPVGDACARTLGQTRVAITWRNERTNRTDDVVFPTCTAGRPSSGAEIRAGHGRISFTTTIIGRADRAFTVTPGVGWFIH